MCRGLRYKEERHELRKATFMHQNSWESASRAHATTCRRWTSAARKPPLGHRTISAATQLQHDVWAIGGGAARTHLVADPRCRCRALHRARSRLAAAIRQDGALGASDAGWGAPGARAPPTIKHHTLTRQSHRHAAAARCRTRDPPTLATPLLRGAPHPFRHSRRDVRRHSARSEPGVLHHGRPTPCRLGNPAAAHRAPSALPHSRHAAAARPRPTCPSVTLAVM